MEIPVTLMETYENSSVVDGDARSSIVYGDGGASDAFVGSVKKTKTSGPWDDAKGIKQGAAQ